MILGSPESFLLHIVDIIKKEIDLLEDYKDDQFWLMKGVDYVFHGHTPVDDPLIIGNRCYIDTGAVFKDGYLTIVEVKDDLIFHKFNS